MPVFKMTRTVLKNLFTRPATRRYPQKVKEPHHAAGSRGKIGIDIETCIFCMLCQKRCPTDAIVVTKGIKEWNIDRLRCCSCNACVEVCPVKCLWMDEQYSPATVTREKDYFRQKPKETPADRPAAPPADGQSSPSADGQSSPPKGPSTPRT